MAQKHQKKKQNQMKKVIAEKVEMMIVVVMVVEEIFLSSPFSFESGNLGRQIAHLLCSTG